MVYDGRGHLFDLAHHDSDNIRNKAQPTLSEEEEAIEKACDEERYLELHTDVREAEMYEEEEWKRYYLSLQEGYQSVGFGYDQPAGGDATQWPASTEQVTAADEKPFIPSEELQVPQGMQTPVDQKQNARIEKTASFIAQHGIQMEIMLKTKQAGNSQFDFLSFENELNAYYKHMVSMIKSGKYKPAQREEEDSSNDTHGDNYLHPSLSSVSSLPPPPPPPSKPIELPKVSIHDTPYGALINSIRKNTEKTKPKKVEISNVMQPVSSGLPYDPSSLEPVQASTSESLPGNKYSNNPPPPGTEPVKLPMVSSLNGPAFVNELYGPQQNPQVSGEVAGTKLRKGRKKSRRSSSSDSSSSSSSSSNSSRSRSPKKKRKPEADSPPKMHGPAPIVPPPPDVCPIVDRMAMYVAKNGAEFEMVVMNRKDPRFQFLNEYHAYFPYYKLKKEMFIEEMAKNKEYDDKSGTSQRSISFSIKPKPRETEAGQPAAKQKPKLFEYDSSEGDEGKEERLRLRTPSEAGSLTPPPSRLLLDDNPQKQMEEKLKDKLANAVKERLSQTTRERQLQQERKKKAAMFLNLIKSSQANEPSPPPTAEDPSSLYVGEASPAPVVFEYDNGQMPRVRDDKSRSPKHKKRRRRSPTPPSAYNLDRRPPPIRPSPPRWQTRQSPWSSVNPRDRDRSPVRQRRSRSPHRKDEKKKKHHKHPRSRSPKHPEKIKDRHSRQSKEKSKHKSSKDHDRRSKEKSRHKSRDRELNDSVDAKKTSNTLSHEETMDKSGIERLSTLYQSRSDNSKTQASDVSESYNSAKQELGAIPVPHVSPFASSSSENLTKGSFIQGKSSMSNSPTLQNYESRSNTPVRMFGDSTKLSSSTDLMSKVRAMLKKSREVSKDEGNVNLEETEAVI